MKLLIVAGARPNFMKIAPIIRALKRQDAVQGSRFKVQGSVEEEENLSHPSPLTPHPSPLTWKLIHTGQHYDQDMSQVFFDELEIPTPDYDLNAGSGTHAEQTAKIMVAFEKVCADERPDVVVVVGDVNSTLACSIVAKKFCIKVAHVEAGLRSGDWTMPEEINRVVTDSISDYLFVTEKNGQENLLKEGKLPESIFFVGHVMVDNLLYMKGKLDTGKLGSSEVGKLKKTLGKYVFLTLHRPSNVDDPETFRGIVDALNEISKDLPILFPVHPRTRHQLNLLPFTFHLSPSICLLPPLSFMESLYLWKDAALVLTDSGGLQEETTALGIPCFTIRENTERPITIEEGTNTLVGSSKDGILAAWRNFQDGNVKKGKVPELWDGHASERIVEILISKGKAK
ncbi:MAG: UDP-N-acetylglucosamine 2-epimerase (non-hydrolyzing) [Proteobacteria bacterium]|nr:UDP-N-acetylglucosamine 2-epimerase (non-hydrolyzing) [Pseudomonadota bacterium]